MQLDDLQHQISSRLDSLRDRTAGAVSAGGESIVPELRRLASHIDGVEKRLGERIDEARAVDVARIDEALSSGKATTWPRRLFWIVLGVAAGAGAAYVADPDRGRARRAQLGDQLTARARDVGGNAVNQAKIAADRMRGSAIEAAKGQLPEDVPDDPKLLEARIRSTVFGSRPDVADVVLRVDGPGRVALKGTVPSAQSERELVAAVSDVEGVTDVASELSVRRS